MTADEARPRGASGALRAAVRFAGELRRAGLRADLGATLAFARALGMIDLGSAEEVRATGAAIFVKGPDDLPVYDAAFDAYWFAGRRDLPDSHGAGGPADEPPVGSRPLPERVPVARPSGTRSAGIEEATATDDGAEEPEAPAESDAPARLAYSPTEALRTKAFDRMTPEEALDAMRLVAELRPRVPRRRTRRHRLHHRGPRLAPRAMLRRSLHTGGDPLDWLWRRLRMRARPIVVLCDISGSMEPYSRFMLRFVHALRRMDVRTEAFVFGTRLTRITPHLRHRDADEALARVAASVRDWAGGTQIGSALRAFNAVWARRVLRSSAIVIIVSDGWDRGDTDEVRRQMRLLSRRCHRLVWLNPLAATANYEPRTAGMAAALPYVDEFGAISSVESLEALGRRLARLAAGSRDQASGADSRMARLTRSAVSGSS